MNNDIKIIIEKIKKLQQKTIDNGCTENEVMISANIVNKLMQEHRIKEEQINFDKDDLMTMDYEFGSKKHPCVYAHHGIEKLCGVKLYTKHEIKTDESYNYIRIKTLKINGFEADVEQAKYLVHIVKLAIDNEIAKFKKGTLYKKSPRKISLVNGFAIAMSSQIGDRLEKMAKDNAWQTHKDNQSNNTVQSTGKDLVVVKEQMIANYLAEKGVRLRSSSSRYSNGLGMGAGRNAGNNVSLNKGVHGSNNQRYIGN